LCQSRNATAAVLANVQAAARASLTSLILGDAIDAKAVNLAS
jgi:hypothetical protein